MQGIDTQNNTSAVAATKQTTQYKTVRENASVRAEQIHHRIDDVISAGNESSCASKKMEDGGNPLGGHRQPRK